MHHNLTFLRPRPRDCLSAVAVAVIAAVAAFASAPARAQADSPCGDVRNAFGPYDYRTDRDKLPIVQGSHFTPEVEALISGKSGYLGGDLDYTLRAFPNHHRALLSMMRYGEKTKSAKPPNAQYTVECYFDRALRFRPDDTTARMIYATYLAKNGREADANRQMAEAVQRAEDNPFTHFTAGLIYFDMKNYDAARQEAHTAMQLGMSRPELRDKLKSVGKWTEPDPAAMAASGATASASPASAASASTP